MNNETKTYEQGRTDAFEEASKYFREEFGLEFAWDDQAFRQKFMPEPEPKHWVMWVPEHGGLFTFNDQRAYGYHDEAFMLVWKRGFFPCAVDEAITAQGTKIKLIPRGRIPIEELEDYPEAKDGRWIVGFTSKDKIALMRWRGDCWNFITDSADLLDLTHFQFIEGEGKP